MGSNKALSIADIQNELGCSLTRARNIVLNELPHTNISSPGAERPRWRVKRKDFDKWMAAREEAAGNDKLTEFSKKYMQGSGK